MGMSMEQIGKLVGEGWLRARGTVSSTAHYRVIVQRCVAGPDAGQIAAKGTVQADFMTLSGGQAAGRAVLILADGQAMAIELTQVGASEAAFDVVGAVPGF